MYKTIKLSLIAAIFVSSSLFAEEVAQVQPTTVPSPVTQAESVLPQIDLKNDFEKDFVKTHGVQAIAGIKSVIAAKGRVEPTMITLLSLNDDISGLKKIYFSLGNDVTNIIYVSVDLKKVVLGEIIDLATLSSDTMSDFQKLNEEALKKQEEAKKAEEALVIPRNKALIDGIHDASLGKNMEFTLEGGNKDGESLVLFTDPLCPYCISFEKEQLPTVLKNAKEIRVVMYPLTSLRGHETSLVRSYWLLQNVKGKKVDEKIKLMKDSTNLDISKIKVDQNSKEFKQYSEDIKKIQAMRIVPGTPSIYGLDGVKK